MNTITHDSESFPFASTLELLATPLVRRFRAMPEVTHFGCDGKLLLAYHGSKYCEVVGRLAEPVRLPKSVARVSADGYWTHHE